MNERGVSVAITHALAIAITTVLLSGLLVASATLLETQENRVGQDQVDDIAGDVATYINSFDRLNETGTNVNATAKPEYGERLVDTYSYQVRLENTTSTNAVVTVEANRLGVVSVFELEVNANIEPRTVEGGPVEINLCSPSSSDPSYITLGGCN